METVRFSNGIEVVNTTPHSLSFLDAGTVVTVPVSGILINAKALNEETTEGCVTFCKPDFVPDPVSEQLLAKLEKENPGVLIIGSMIAAQAYPGRVIGMVAAPGFERVPPAEKRMSTSRFTRF